MNPSFSKFWRKCLKLGVQLIEVLIVRKWFRELLLQHRVETQNVMRFCLPLKLRCLPLCLNHKGVVCIHNFGILYTKMC